MRRLTSFVMTVLLVFATSVAALSPAKGTLSFKGKAREFTVAFKFAYLVKGPDEIDPKTIIRRLILTTQDLEKKLQACQTMSCTTDDLTEGLSIDVDPGPRLNYWMVLNGGLVQHSDTEALTSLMTTTNSPTRLAGKLVFDSTGKGGPKVSAEFDAPVLKTVGKAR